jgi:hypothetical protein
VRRLPSRARNAGIEQFLVGSTKTLDPYLKLGMEVTIALETHHCANRQLKHLEEEIFFIAPMMPVERPSTPIRDEGGQFEHRPDGWFCLRVDIFDQAVE